MLGGFARSIYYECQGLYWENRVTAPRRPSTNRDRELHPVRRQADRPYREIVTAMVVETLRLFCGLRDKDACVTFRESISSE